MHRNLRLLLILMFFLSAVGAHAAAVKTGVHMAGTDRLQKALELQRRPGEIQHLWNAEVGAFRKNSARCLLYGER